MITYTVFNSLRASYNRKIQFENVENILHLTLKYSLLTEKFILCAFFNSSSSFLILWIAKCRYVIAAMLILKWKFRVFRSMINADFNEIVDVGYARSLFCISHCVLEKDVVLSNMDDGSKKDDLIVRLLISSVIQSNLRNMKPFQRAKGYVSLSRSIKFRDAQARRKIVDIKEQKRYRVT